MVSQDIGFTGLDIYPGPFSFDKGNPSEKTTFEVIKQGTQASKNTGLKKFERYYV